jgi:uncharacterized protein
LQKCLGIKMLEPRQEQLVLGNLKSKMTEECEFPKSNATTDEIRNILNVSKVIAVVGLSDKTDRPSYHVAEYLQSNGYKIIPVNPMISQWKGMKSYPNLKAIPEPVDIIDIFRRPDDVSEIVDEAISQNAKVIWMQEGIVNNVAADRARNAGLQVVMNKCMLKEHRKLI